MGWTLDCYSVNPPRPFLPQEVYPCLPSSWHSAQNRLDTGFPLP